MFLRRRNGSWELKVGKDGSGEDGVWQYDELEEEAAIRQELSLAAEGSFEEALAAAGFAEFVSIDTRRTKHTLGEFTIDVDSSTYPDGDTYDMVEVELLTDDRETGKKLLLQFEGAHRLPPAEIRGKLQEYCHRHDPERWKIYQETGLAVE